MRIISNQDYMHVESGEVETAEDWAMNSFRDKVQDGEFVSVIEVEDENGNFHWKEDK